MKKIQTIKIKSVPLIAIIVLILGLATFSIIKITTQIQHIGQVGVWTSITNKFIKTTTNPGINNWNPLNNVSYYDVKNNTIKFSINDESGEDENSEYAPSITIQNNDGVFAEVELSVTYSINPDKVKEIWEKYENRQSFKSNVILQIIRSNVYNVFTSYTSLETRNNRSDIEKAITENLVKEFEDKGVLIQNVSIQNINYSPNLLLTI